jgi:hypothetical protein
MTQQSFEFPVSIGVKVTATFTDESLVWKQGVRTFTIPWNSVEAFGVQAGPKMMGINASMLLVKCSPCDGVKPKYSLSFAPGEDQAKALLEAMKVRLPASADTTQLPWEEAAPRLGTKVKNPWQNIPNGRVLLGTLMFFVNIFQITLNRPDPEIQNQDYITGFYAAHVLIYFIAFWLIWSGKKKAKREREKEQS